MFQNFAAALPYMQAGLQIGGGIADMLERGQESKILDAQKKLALKASAREQRQAFARQSGATARSGVKMTGTTLDKLNDTMTQYMLDQEVIKASVSMQQAALGREGRQDLMGGIIGGIGTIAPLLKKPEPIQTPQSQIKKNVNPFGPQSGFGPPWAMMGGVK